MSSPTVVDVVISGTTATVVDTRVDGITTVEGTPQVTNVSGQIPDLGVTTNYLAGQGEILSLINDVANLRANVIITGQTLTDEIGVLSGVLISTGNYLESNILTLSGDLIASGNNLDSLRDILSGNLITTGQTLQTQITSNISDISTLTANLLTTGQTLSDEKFDKSGGILSGNVLPSLTETFDIGSSAKKWNSLYAKDAHIDTSTVFLGDAGAKIKVVSNRIQLEGNSAAEGAQFIGDTHVDAGTLFAQKAFGAQFKILNTNATNLYEFHLDDDGHLNISGNLTGAVKFADPVTIEGSSAVKANQTGVFATDVDLLALTSNVVVTGQTLQTQITSNDSDIATLDSTTVKLTTNQSVAGNKIFSDRVTINNLHVTGTEVIVDVENLAVKDNLIHINSGESGAGISRISGGITIDRGTEASANILYNDANERFEFNFPLALEGNLAVTANQTGVYASAANLITTGQTLQTQITSNDGDISTLTTNLATTGATLTSEVGIVSGLITDNDGDITALKTATGVLKTSTDANTSNLISTGNFLESEIAIVSGVAGGAVVDALSGNLITTGQTLTTDINTVSSNLITTGQTLTSEIAIVSGLTTGSSSDPDLSGKVDTLSGNLITTGQTLQTQITSNDTDITNLTSNVITTGQTLTSEIIIVSGIAEAHTDVTALSGNLITTGQTLTTDINAVSSNLITTGQTLQTQITSNDSDISNLTSNVITTGQTLTSEIAIVSGIAESHTDVAALSGKVDDISGNLITTGQTLQTQITSNDGDITTLTSNLITTGQTLTSEIAIVSGIATGGSAEDFAALSGDLITTGQTLQTQITSNDSDISTLTSNLITTGQTLTTDINTVSTNLISTGAVVDDISGNLITTGQTLQTQITSNDSDISTLTSNLISTGSVVDDVSGNLITTGQTLTTSINTNSSNLITTGQTLTSEIAIVSGIAEAHTDVSALSGKVDDISGNLITTGQTLTTNINAVSTNLITSGQTLQTQITSNDSDISTLTTNLVTTGQTLTTDINTVASNLVSTGSVVDDISGNLITTGQTLQTQITSNDGDITNLTSNLITTGQTLTSEIGTVSGLITDNDAEITALLAATGELKTDTNTNASNLVTTGQTLTSEIVIVSGIAEAHTDISELSGNLITTGQTLTTNINTVSSNLVSTGSIVDDISGNLITTGQTLQTQITSNDGDIANLTTNLITTGQTLTTEINTVSGLITDNDAEITALLAATGELKTDTNTNASNLITTGQTLTTNINTVSTNLVSTGSVVDDISGNLITTGQTLQTQITSNDGDITSLTSNLITTGQTLTTEITTVSGLITDNDGDITALKAATGVLKTSTDDNTANLISTGAIVDDISGNLITSGQTLQTQITSNDSDISTLTTNVITTGQTLQTQITSNDGDISTLTSNLITTGQTLTSEIAIVSGIATGGSAQQFADLSGNLITTGQTLQTQITSNDSDISTLTSNLISTGSVVDNISGNLITTGQTLQTQITSNDSDISTLTSNLVTTGQTLTTNVNTVSSNLVSTGSIVDDISGNLITTGQTLQTQITSNDTDITNLTSNLVTTGQTLTTDINTVSSNLVSTGSVVDDISGNLITTGQTLQTQITSNDGDITSLTSNLITTGQTLQTQITSNDGDIATLDSTTVKITTNQSVAGNKIFTDTVTINNLTVTGTEVIVDVENLAVRDNIIHINSGESGAGISRISGGITIDRGTAPSANILYNDANDRFELNFPLATEGNVVASAANLITTGQTLTTSINTVSTNLVSTGSVVDDISGNLITTGQTLQTQITANDADIATNVSNISSLTTNLVTTGQTLQTQITSNDSDISTLTSNLNTTNSNLVTTGQTLTTNINTVSANLVSTGSVVDDISGNLITTGQTLQTQITSNDGDISTLTSNLVTTGQTLTTNINTVSSNLISTGAIVDDISGNLITTGQTLQTQITSNDTDITNLTSNLVTTGQTLTTNIDTVATNLVTTGQTLTSEIITVSGLIPPTVVDGAGVTGYTARWYDGNTLTTGALYDNGTNVGIGNASPGDFHSAGSRLVIGNGVSNQGVTLYAASDAASQINFADGSAGNASYRGIVSYDHSADKMNISTAATIRMSIDSSGKVGIGTNSPAKTFDVNGTSYFRNNIYLVDGAKAVFGGGDDLKIYHDGSNSHIKNTGSLYVASETSGDLYLRSDDDIFIQPQGGENGITLTGNGAVSLYYDNAIKLATTATGVSVTGQLDLSSHLDMPDNAWIKLGASDDLLITHDGSSSWIIDNGAGGLVLASDSLYIKNAAYNETGLSFIENGAVTLFYDNAAKIATTSTGTETTGLGSITNTAAGVQTALKLSNNTAGASNRVAIDFYTASTKYGTIEAGYGAASPEMNFKVGNPTAQILKLNSTGIDITGNATFADNGKAIFGGGNDLQIYHDGTDSFIKDAGQGNLKLLTDEFRLRNAADSAHMLTSSQGGAVTIYHNGAQKLITTSTGVTVTGALKTTTILDTNDSAGTNGQVLTTTGSALDWKTLAEISGVDGSGTAGYLSKWTDSDTIGNSVIIESSSKIGIGIATPYGRLETAITPTVAATTVNETADFADKFVISNAGTSANGDRIPLIFNVGGDGADNISTAIVGEREASGWNSALSFWVNNVTAGSEGVDAIQEAMRITSAGCVGIGTTAPERRLHVEHADTTTKAALAIENSYVSGADASVWFKTVDREWTIGIDESNSGAFTFSNNSVLGTTDRVTIQRDGNVGIGTTTPSADLEVSTASGGEFLVTRSGNSGVTLQQVNGGDATSGSLSIKAGTAMTLYTNGTGRALTIDSSQKVGIGTSSFRTIGGLNPSLLNIEGVNGQWDSGLTIVSNATGDYEAACVVLGRTGGTTAGSNTIVTDNDVLGRLIFTAADGVDMRATPAEIRSSVDDSSPAADAIAGNLEFYTNDGSGVAPTSRLIIDPSGKVGIGETSPGSYWGEADDLVIKAASGNTTGMTLVSNSTSGSCAIAFADGTSGNAAYRGRIEYSHNSDHSLDKMYLGAGASTTLTLDWVGNVGIGTTAPATRLQVKDTQDSSFDSGISVIRSANSQTGYISMVGGAFNFNAPAGVATKFRDGGTTNVTILGDGKVGIGTDSPEAGLHLNFSNDVASIILENDANAVKWKIIPAIPGVANSGLSFYDVTNTAVRMHLDNAGKVGIGTTAPGQQLSVGNAGAQTQIYTNGSGHSVLLNNTANKDFNYAVTGTGGHWFATSGANRLNIGSDGTLNLISAKFKINGSAGSSGQTLTTDGSGNISWSAAGSGTISGSGTDNYIPRFNGTSAIENSNIIDDGTSIRFTAHNDGTYIPVAVPNTINTGWNNSGDSHALWINYYGYLGSTSKFRDLRIGDGKAVSIAHFDGSSREVTFSGLITTTGNSNGRVTNWKANGSGWAVNVFQTNGGVDKWAHGINSSNEYYLYNYATSTTDFIIKADGKVGIGTTAPSMTDGGLQVHSTASTGRIKLTSATTGAGSTDGFALVTDASGNIYYYNREQTYQGFYNHNGTTVAEVCRMTSDGKVGIGTTAPAQILHVAGGNLSTIRNNMFGVTSNTPQTGGETNVYHNAYYDTVNSREEYLVADEACKIQFVNGQINFRTAAAGSADGAITWINAMGILADGKVGIGTDTPTANLHIKPATGNSRLKLESDNTSADVEMMLDSANSTRNAHITFYNAGVQKGGVGYVSSDAIMKMWGGNNPADDHLCINSAGSVGIGTPSPSAALEISSADTGWRGQLMIRDTDTASTAAPYITFWDGNENGSGSTGLIGRVGSVNGSRFDLWSYRAADPMTFATAGVERVRIDNAGKVGIGTTAPSSLLHVYGSGSYLLDVHQTAVNWAARIKNTSGGGYGLSIDTSSGPAANGVYSLACYTPAGSGVFVTNQARLGVGATSPDSLLHIEDDNTLGQHLLHLKGGGASGAYGMLVEAADGTDLFKIDTLTYKVTMPSGYSVGIGNDAPVSLLHVQKYDSGNYTGEVRVGGSSTAHGILTSYTQLGNTEGSIHVAPGYANSNALFKLRCSTNNTNQLVLKGDGKIGIGTDAPAYLFHVKGAAADIVVQSTTGTNRAGFQSANTGGTSFFYKESSAGAGSIAGTAAYATVVAGTGAYPLQLGTNNAVRLTIDSAGKVGIGTTAPETLTHLYSASDTTLRITAGTSSNALLNFGDSSDTDRAYINYSNSTDRLYLSALNTRGADITIDGGTGNVGIGTASSITSKLKVEASTDGDKLSLENTSTGGRAFWTWVAGASYGVTQQMYDNTNTLKVFIRSYGDSYFNGGNVGIGSASPAAPLDVPRASDYKVIKLGDDITSHYVMTGNADHTLTLTCASYFQAEIVITANQTNGGTYNNLYIRGIWSNNHTSHHWDEIENVGNLSSSTFTITNGQNGGTTNSGEWKIVHDYVSGSFAGMTVRITDFYGTHAYTIS